MSGAHRIDTHESHAVEFEQLYAVEHQSVEQTDLIIHLAFADDSIYLFWASVNLAY
jgi:hypothetical protein